MFFLIFCLDYVPIVESEDIKGLALQSVSPLRQICYYLLLIFGSPMLSACLQLLIFMMKRPLWHYIMLFFISCYTFDLNTILPDTGILQLKTEMSFWKAA